MERNQESLNRARFDRSFAIEPPPYGALAKRSDMVSAYDFARPGKNDERIRYLVLLRRYRRPVAAIVGACLLAAAIYTLVASKVYKAHTVLEVMSINQDFMNNKNVDPNATASSSNDSYLDTQSKLLLSEPVVDKTAELLSPTVPPALTHKRSRLAPVLGWFGISGVTERDPDAIVRKMLATAKVKPMGQSSLLELTIEGPSPRLVADAANTLASQYRSQTQQARWDTAAQTGQFLLTELDGFRKKLLTSEDDLQNYARETGLVYTADSTHESVATDKLRQIEGDLARAEAERRQKEARLETAKTSPPDTIPQAVDDTELRALRAKIDDLQREDVELRATLTPSHYKVQRVEAQIAELQKQMQHSRDEINKRIENDYTEANRKAQLEKQAYEQQLTLVSQQNLKEVKYNMLKREVDANREIYQSMLQRVNEANVMSALRASNVRVVAPAKAPFFPALPSWPIDLGIGFLLGCVASLLYILLRERMDRSVRMPGESLMIVDVPELAVIPSAKLDPRSPIPFGKRPSMQRLDPGNTSIAPQRPANLLEMPASPALKWGEMDSLIAESFRSAVTSILLGGRSELGQRLIVVTSAHPQAGKTTAVFSLGLGLAESGRKVLIIDGDMRRPRLGQIFGVQGSDGLSNLLTGDPKDNDVKNLVRPTGIPGLSILPSGSMPANIAQALHSTRLDDILKLMRDEYDFVLVDTPPMIPLTDARLLGQHSDGVILICRSGQTTMDQLISTRRRLGEDGIHVMGTILNDWNAYSEDPSYLHSYAEYSRPAK